MGLKLQYDQFAGQRRKLLTVQLLLIRVRLYATQSNNVFTPIVHM